MAARLPRIAGSRTNETENVAERVTVLTDPPAVLDRERTSVKDGAGAPELLDRYVEGLDREVRHRTPHSSGRLAFRRMEAKVDVAGHDSGQAAPVNRPVEDFPIPRHRLLYVLDEEYDPFD